MPTLGIDVDSLSQMLQIRHGLVNPLQEATAGQNRRREDRVTRTFCAGKHPKGQCLTGKARRGTLIPVSRCFLFRAENEGSTRVIPPPLHARDSPTRFKHLSSTVHKWFPPRRGLSPGMPSGRLSESRCSLTTVCYCHPIPGLQKFMERKRVVPGADPGCHQ
jgi:hypothetical protein